MCGAGAGVVLLCVMLHASLRTRQKRTILCAPSVEGAERGTAIVRVRGSFADLCFWDPHLLPLMLLSGNYNWATMAVVTSKTETKSSASGAAVRCVSSALCCRQQHLLLELLSWVDPRGMLS